KHQLERLLSEGFNAQALDRLGRLCQESGLRAEANAWFELAAPANARLRSRVDSPPGFTVMIDDPPMALSRPVLRSSLQPRPPERPPGMVSRPDSGPRFEDVAAQSGVRFQYDCGATPQLFIADTLGGGVALVDYDNDDWLDIYFINGCSLHFDRRSPPRPNRLYHNQGDGTFEEVTERAGVAGRGYGMGCTVGDFDNDGFDD